MKYSSLPYKKEQILKVEPPIKGVNNYDKAGKIDPLQAVRLNNVIIENGCIKNRMGLNSNFTNLLDLEDFYNPFGVETFLTDCEVSIDGKNGKIAVAYVKNDEATHIYRMFLVSGDSSCEKMGDIYFGRTSEFVFYTPVNILFFKAAPQTGGGIFAFVQLANMYAPSSTETRIYEIDSEYKNWQQYISSYIPTVYINGRGNAYEEAKANDTAYTGTPKNLETLNLLDGVFYAYYSSDGYSSLFRLPYADLADRSVSCKLYSDPSNYIKWVIYEGQTSSAEMDCNGKKVKMYVDRLTGTVYFKCGNENMPLPVMSLYPQNNICFTAVRETGYSFDDIVSCKIAVPCGNKVFFANGNRQSEIFVCDKDNPFYFPQCFNNSVGDDGGKVTAMCSTGEKLFAFKETGVYSVELKGEKYLNKVALLADNTSYFKDLGDFEITRISNNWGCDNPDTLKVIGKKPIWLSKSGEICTVENNSVKTVSQNIDKKSLEIFNGNSSSATSLNSYILMNENNVFVLNMNGGLSASYFWDFPEKISLIGAVSNGDETAFLVNTKDTLLFYAAFLKGDKDIVLISETEYEEYPFQKVICTKNFLESSSTKRINRVVLNCEYDKELQLEIGSKAFKESFVLSQNNQTKENETDIILGKFGTKSVALELKTKGNIVFEGAEIFYS